jgi:hypothetical protein
MAGRSRLLIFCHVVFLPKMMSLELAKSGDVGAIATLVSESIDQPVTGKLQFGILVLTVDSTDTKICTPIIEKLNEIKPNRLTVQIVGKLWNKVFNFKDGKYTENTNTTVVSGLIVVGIFGILALWAGSAYVSRSPAPVVAPPPEARTFVGTGPTGYEVWQDKSCVYVKGLREDDLQRMNTDLNGVKKVVKEQSGYSCVLFE